MKFEIKHRFDGNIIFSLETTSLKFCVEAAVNAKTYLRGADLQGADLRNADLRGADLRNADLRGADLRNADLQGADLRNAYLRGAYLRGADLQGADLQGAIGINKYLSTPLLFLMDQPGQIRAYKLVNNENRGPYYPTIEYKIGESYEVIDADRDPEKHCSTGISVATLDWCIKEFKPGYKILIAEFTAADIAAIPTATDGKFRVHRCKIVGEKDLVELEIHFGGQSE